MTTVDSCEAGSHYLGICPEKGDVTLQQRSSGLILSAAKLCYVESDPDAS